MSVLNNIEDGKYINRVLRLDHDSKVAYRDEQTRLDMLFKADLEEEFGFENHPKRDRLFRLAWEDGHANGYREVYNSYDYLSELM